MGEIQLPPHWKVIELGKVCKVCGGYAFKSSDYTNQGIPLIKIGNLQNGYVIINNDNDFLPEVWMTFENLKDFLLREGDVLIAMTGATTGKVAVVSSNLKKAFLNQRVGKIKPISENIDSEFIVFIVKSATFQNSIQDKILRSAQGNISPYAIEQIKIPYPPLPEQKTIAHNLRTIQKAKETRQRELELELERKAALMQYLFTHGTNPEFNPFQKTRFGKVPQHWKIVPLEKCAFIQTGTAKGRKFQDNETVILPYLRVANVQDGYLDLSEIKEISIRKSEVERYSLQVNDVVLTEGGDPDKLGRGFIWEGQIPNCIHQNHIFAVRTYQEILLPKYLAYLVQSDYGKAYFLSVAHRTTNLASINSTKLKAFPTLVPNISEQKRIVTILQICDRKIQALEKEITLIDELFHAMLEQLMTGKISTQPLTETYV